MTTPAEVLRQAREALAPCPHCGLLHTLKLTTAQELAARCEIVESCRKCRHSVGRQSCALAGRDFDGASIPAWCPLPVYGTAPLMANGLTEAETSATASVAGLAEHVPVGLEAEAATDAKLGMVLLPPIRVSAHAHAILKRIAEVRGMVLQAVVREALEPGETMGAAPQAAPVPAPSELAAARWEGIQSVQAQTAVIVRAALELLDAAGDNFPPETLAAFRHVFGGASSTAAAAPEPMATSPEFTDSARAALLWVLWHHQGGSSPVGQPLRFALGMDAHEPLQPHQIAEAKRWAAQAGAMTTEFQAAHPAPAVAATAKPLTLPEAAELVSDADLDWHRGFTLDPMEVNRYLRLIRAVEARCGIATPAAPKEQP